MRITPARLLRSALWRTGRAFQTLAAHVPAAPPDAAPAPEVIEDKNDPVEILEDEGGWVTCRIDDLIWRLDPTQCIDRDLLEDGMFEPYSTNWLSRIIQPGMVAVDVGANFGYYAVQLSKLVGPAGQVHAFEPSQRYRERLLDHLQRNNCENVIVSDEGLSDEQSEQVLYGDDISATMHWADDGKPPTVAETIRLRTLDSYVEETKLTRMDFIKVDIDGHEPKFIAGAAGALERFQPIILIEFSQINLMAANSDVESLARQLTSLGYSLYSETTGEPYLTRANFLRDVMNCSHSVNMICRPGGSRSPIWPA